MAYTPIDKGENFFNTKLYTGNGGTNNITGVGFPTNLVWLKERSESGAPILFDLIRGVGKFLRTSSSAAQVTQADTLTAFTTDGFTLGADSADYSANQNSKTYASWSWKAGGSNPAKTYVVKVVSDGGNKYRLDDFAANAVTLELSEGGTFTFDQSDSSNNGHPLRFSTTSNGTHGGGSIYTTGVTVSGTPGQAGAKTVIIVAASAPTLYYFCTVHSGMGGQANTPTTNSFTNLDGNIQSNISPATTFSIVSYTAGSSGANSDTIGHGLGVAPSMIMLKTTTATDSWVVYHKSNGAGKSMVLNSTATVATNTNIYPTTPTNSVFYPGNTATTNSSSRTYVAYCFAEIQGFSKMGSYLGNGNANGTFIYTGFKPAFMMVKRAIGGTGNWHITDNKRDPFNVNDAYLSANVDSAESDFDHSDFLSNGIKFKTNNDGWNQNGNTYVYMAFAENPFVSAAGIPVTAR